MDFNKHYDKVAPHYDEFKLCEWDDKMFPWTIDQTKTKLGLQKDDCLADIGGGTGRAIGHLKDLVQPDTPWICMDPSSGMCEVAGKREGLVILQSRADTVTTVLNKAHLMVNPNKFMCRYAAHHFKDVFPKFAQDLFSYLQSGGQMLLLVTDRKCSLPMFDEARRRFAESNPDPMLYVDSFNQAGFSTTIDRRDYTTKGTKKFWYDLIRNRMFSTLRDFTDAEIEDGIKELDDKYPDTDELPLISHEVFILATKP